MFKQWPTQHKSVQSTINKLKQADNAIESLRCQSCGKSIGRLESYNYKGTRCTPCFHTFYQSEYDTTPNDSTARFCIKMGKDSPFVKHATPEQRKYAVEYFKIHGKENKPTLQEQVEMCLK
jgi:protein-arginine kinase activator protein McsA